MNTQKIKLFIIHQEKNAKHYKLFRVVSVKHSKGLLNQIEKNEDINFDYYYFFYELFSLQKLFCGKSLLCKYSLTNVYLLLSCIILIASAILS